MQKTSYPFGYNTLPSHARLSRKGTFLTQAVLTLLPGAAFAALEPPSLMLPVFIAALLFVTLSAIVAFSRRASSKTSPFNTLPHHLVAGYYFYDIKQQHEHLSDSLKTTLQLPKEACSFDALKHRFSPEDYIKLEMLCKKGIYTPSSELSRLILQPVTTENSPKIWLECTLTLSLDKDNDAEIIRLWFVDISDKIHAIEMKSGEQSSLKSELHHMQLLLDTIPFPVWSRSTKLDITYANRCYKQLVGNRQDTTLPELDQHKPSLGELTQKTGQSESGNRHIVVEGARRLFHLMEIPQHDDNIIIGVGHDITKQEEVEKSLEFHVAVQSDLLESSSSAMAIYGADTHLKFFNQAFMKLWELDEAWLGTQPSYGEILEALREKRKLPEQINFRNFKQDHLRLFTTLTEPYNEFFYLPDGRSLRMIAIPHTLGGLLFAYEDMTDRLALESSYNMLAAVQKATIDNLHEGIAVIGQNGRLKLYNPAYARMWYHDMEKLKTEPHFADLVETARNLYTYNDEWETVKNRVLSMLSNRVPLKERVVRTDGLVLDRICVPLPDGATLMSYVDVTDSILAERSLREKNEALQEADRIKTEFLANISYELRSPLTSILGLSEALEKQYFGGLNDRQKEYIQGIYTSSQHLLLLINDILDLASIEAGYMVLDVEHFNIHAALSSVLSLVRERAKKSGVTLAFDCLETIGAMAGEEKRIKQAILKLLSNALTFTPAGGTITLSAKEEDELIIITVQDNGEGIAEDDQHAIFDKFYRTEAARITGRAGAGLGLSVVKNFIELHGGHIMLESSLGVGTTLHCLLPKDNKIHTRHMAEPMMQLSTH